MDFHTRSLFFLNFPFSLDPNLNKSQKFVELFRQFFAKCLLIIRHHLNLIGLFSKNISKQEKTRKYISNTYTVQNVWEIIRMEVDIQFYS